MASYVRHAGQDWRSSDDQAIAAMSVPVRLMAFLPYRSLVRALELWPQLGDFVRVLDKRL